MTVDIPGYKIVKTLGKGGMATVYLAVQEIFEREVALKVMSKSLAEDPSFGQRFLREARIVSQLVHPNIVTVYDVGVHDGAYYLSMEYIEGKDLKHMRKRIGFRDKISIIKDMGKALDFAGKKGYVHRDIKPENIMVYAKERRAVLMDFGIARAAEADISVTQAGTAIGTPHYMSPEQAKGRDVDTRADIYGLGVVFYYLLIGQVPYDGDSAVSIGIKHITEAIPLLPHHLEPLQFILDGMMAKDPDDRFQTGGELVAALDIIDIDELEAAEQDAQAERKAAKQQEITTPTLISIQSDLIAKGATGGITQVNDPDRYTVSFDSLDTPPERGRWVWPVITLAIAVFVGVGGYFITQVETGDGEHQTRLEEDLAAQNSLAELIRGANSDTEQLSKLPPAIKTKRQAKMEAELKRLQDKFKRDSSTLPQLVEIHKQLIAMLPEEKKYQQSYLALVRSQLSEVGPLFSAGQFKQAQKNFNRVQVLFPEFSSELLTRLRSRLANRSVIESRLDTAHGLYKKGLYTEPAGGNAVEAYRAVLSVDDEIYPAKVGLRQIANSLADSAEKELSRNQVDKALAMLDEALEIDPGNAAATAIKSRMNSRESLAQQIKALLEKADRQVFHGDYYGPKGRSAFDSYSQVLVLDKDNRQALNGLNVLLSKVEERSMSLVRQGKYEDAKNSLVAAYDRRNGDGDIQLLMFRVDEAILAAEKNDLPRVGVIRASSDRRIKLSTAQPLSISSGKKIYFRFSYSNFPESKSLINAVLYGEGRKRELAKVQVVVAGEEGESDFLIDSPRSDFAAGNYTIDLKVEKNTIGTLSFNVER